MKKIIIANWKANPATLKEAKDLFLREAEAAEKFHTQTVICPPFVYLEELAKLARGAVKLGAQDIFWENPTMLKNFGVSHVLAGHSDRRYLLGETDEIINKKIKAALEAGITPVLLVGERNRGDDRREVLEEQLTKDLANLLTSQVRKLLICYEPVWAISTAPGAEADTPESALETISIIRNFLNSKFQTLDSSFLYGGSVTEKNVADFLSNSEIGGAVVGGASLRKEEFTKILEVASSLT